jgi:hypothetical protein
MFVLFILWPLERYELTQAIRAMEIEVKTFNLDKTDAGLKKVFKKYGIDAELRKIDPEDKEAAPSTILYYLTLSPDFSVDRLSGEIFSSDSQNIDSLQWQQKKSSSYSYQCEKRMASRDKTISDARDGITTYPVKIILNLGSLFSYAMDACGLQSHLQEHGSPEYCGDFVELLLRECSTGRKDDVTYSASAFFQSIA